MMFKYHYSNFKLWSSYFCAQMAPSLLLNLCTPLALSLPPYYKSKGRFSFSNLFFSSCVPLPPPFIHSLKAPCCGMLLTHSPGMASPWQNTCSLLFSFLSGYSPPVSFASPSSCSCNLTDGVLQRWLLGQVFSLHSLSLDDLIHFHCST